MGKLPTNIDGLLQGSTWIYGEKIKTNKIILILENFGVLYK